MYRAESYELKHPVVLPSIQQRLQTLITEGSIGYSNITLTPRNKSFQNLTPSWGYDYHNLEPSHILRESALIVAGSSEVLTTQRKFDEFVSHVVQGLGITIGQNELSVGFYEGDPPSVHLNDEDIEEKIYTARASFLETVMTFRKVESTKSILHDPNYGERTNTVASKVKRETVDIYDQRFTSLYIFPSSEVARFFDTRTGRMYEELASFTRTRFLQNPNILPLITEYSALDREGRTESRAQEIRNQLGENYYLRPFRTREERQEPPFLRSFPEN